MAISGRRILLRGTWKKSVEEVEFDVKCPWLKEKNGIVVVISQARCVLGSVKL